jgi:anti-anti-sigma regulatory factor
MKLTYQPLKNEEVLRVVCEGSVSLRGLPKGTEPLLDLLGPHCYRQKVILNFERTDGVDTSGLTWLVRVATRFNSSGGSLTVYGFSATFRNMLDILGMTGTVALASSEQLAIDSVSRPTGSDSLTENGAPRQGLRTFPGSPQGSGG